MDSYRIVTMEDQFHIKAVSSKDEEMNQTPYLTVVGENYSYFWCVGALIAA